jgi:ATP-dependent protease ClpP protease subunit
VKLSSLTRKGVPRSALAKSRARPWWRIENAATGDTADIYLFDEISWFGVTARDVIDELRALEAEKITLHINSPGGDVFDGIAIYQALRAHPAEITTRVEGLAASIATVIAMAGDRIVMAKHSTMMIHDPWGFTIGNAEDHEKQAAVLNQLGDEIASIYAEQADTGTRHDQQVAKWRAKMRAETWYTDQQAVDDGLADEVDEGTAASAKNRFDLSVFRNVPEHLRRPETDPAPADPPRPDQRPEPAPARPAHDTAALEGLRDGLRALRGAA